MTRWYVAWSGTFHAWAGFSDCGCHSRQPASLISGSRADIDQFCHPGGAHSASARSVRRSSIAVWAWAVCRSRTSDSGHFGRWANRVGLIDNACITRVGNDRTRADDRRTGLCDNTNSEKSRGQDFVCSLHFEECLGCFGFENGKDVLREMKQNPAAK